MNPRNHQDALAAHPRLRRFLFADDAVLFFGPFALLWRGQVRACLPYLPLAVLAVAAHGVLSFGIARQSVGWCRAARPPYCSAGRAALPSGVGRCFTKTQPHRLAGGTRFGC